MLLCEDYRPAVADFGMTKVKETSSAQSTAMQGRGGTSRWAAPETFTAGHRKFTEACDVYSFAMTMYEVLTRKIPFEGKNQNQFVMLFCVQHKRPDVRLVEPGCPPKLKELMVRCWNEDPAARPAFPEIVAALEPILAAAEQQAEEDAAAPKTLASAVGSLQRDLDMLREAEGRMKTRDRIIRRMKHLRLARAWTKWKAYEVTDAETNAMKRRIVQWLGHDSHVLEGSMDDKTTHVGKLLTHVRNFVDDNVENGEDKPIALCFCGPSALAHTLGRAAASVGGELE